MSELGSKEIVNLLTGERLGLVGEGDLVIDEAGGGQIVELVLPARRGLWGVRAGAAIPWSSVRRIGPEVVLVELDDPPNAASTARRAAFWSRDARG
jgi:YlmC/YmxH family sporulation protein